MIVKFFELKKKNLKEFQFFLLYGNNRGLIEETCNKLIKPIKNGNIFTYDENEIIKNVENFEETILVKSFFDNEKIIIINRTTDKIFKVIEKIFEKNLKDITIILIAGILEKKSKIRNFFEKNKRSIIVPFYEDNYQSLNLLTNNFLKESQILLSPQNITSKFKDRSATAAWAHVRLARLGQVTRMTRSSLSGSPLASNNEK